MCFFGSTNRGLSSNVPVANSNVFLTAATDLTGALDKFGFLSLFLVFLPFLRSRFAIY